MSLISWQLRQKSTGQCSNYVFLDDSPVHSNKFSHTAILSIVSIHKTTMHTPLTVASFSVAKEIAKSANISAHKYLLYGGYATIQLFVQQDSCSII